MINVWYGIYSYMVQRERNFPQIGLSNEMNNHHKEEKQIKHLNGLAIRPQISSTTTYIYICKNIYFLRLHISDNYAHIFRTVDTSVGNSFGIPV